GDGQLDLISPSNQYGGWGAAYDPNLLVYQWDSYYPQSPNYQVATPWVAPEKGPLELFQNTLTFSNTVSLAGNTELGNYRLSYSNFYQEGIIPNSTLNRDNFSLNSSFDLSDKLSASASANYSLTDVQGRVEGGLGGAYTNIMTNVRQYWQPNIDLGKLKDL